MAMKSLGLHLIVVEIRGDLPALAQLMGFRSWAHDSAPCPFCDADGENMFNFARCSTTTPTWHEYTHEEIEDEIEKHVIKRTIATAHQRHKLVKSLFFDTRRRGFAGRACKYDVPSLNLLRGDRLDPQYGLLDVHTVSPLY